MSKITQAKKEAKLKGKAKKIAESNARKAEAKEVQAPKPNVPNADRCCHCKSYAKFPCGVGHQCKLTGKPTPRKATCPKHDFK